MGIVANWLWSSVNDASIPYLRPSVEQVFDAVSDSRGLPSKQDFRDLRSRVDMVDFQARELNKQAIELRAQLQRWAGAGAAGANAPGRSGS